MGGPEKEIKKNTLENLNIFHLSPQNWKLYQFKKSEKHNLNIPENHLSGGICNILKFQPLLNCPNCCNMSIIQKNLQ